MYNCVNNIEASFGLEKLAATFSEDFSGVNRTLIQMSAEYMSLGSPLYLTQDMQLPAIYASNGRVVFEMLCWGRQVSERRTVEYWREANRSRIACPALVPVSFIDMVIDERPGSPAGVIRLRNADGQHLYVGAMYWSGGTNLISSVTPLLVEAGPDLAPYCARQPLLIPTDSRPDWIAAAISLFICPSMDSRGLQKPSKSGSLAVTRLR
jgi:hypothetical protein